MEVLLKWAGGLAKLGVHACAGTRRNTALISTLASQARGRTLYIHDEGGASRAHMLAGRRCYWLAVRSALLCLGLHLGDQHRQTQQPSDGKRCLFHRSLHGLQPRSRYVSSRVHHASWGACSSRGSRPSFLNFSMSVADMPTSGARCFSARGSSGLLHSCVATGYHSSADFSHLAHRS